MQYRISVNLSAGLLGLGCLLGCGSVTAAQTAQPLAESHPPGAPALSLDRAIAQAEQHFKARVVRANEEDVDGRRIYVLRLLSEEGRVWTVRIDAQSGVMN